jgi:peptidoglycan/xylan/chitin deacetylase (PgdA/CDA1 family)
MKAGLDTLLATLDAANAPVSFFLRDDDAGWADAALFALLDRTERAGVPIDLAVIPQATGAALATSLCIRAGAAPHLIGVHQHGHSHTNHESAARKCEFGNARSGAAQRDDLRAGRDRLRDLFGTRLDPIFTPPWNRCSAATPALLVALGFETLSRSRGAPAQHALFELPVDVDWCKQRRLASQQGDDGLTRIALELAQRVAAGGPVGLMLHHAEMNAHDLALLGTLLGATREHPRARWQPMRDLQAAPVRSGMPTEETT